MTRSANQPDVVGEPADRRRSFVGAWAPIAATVLWVALAVRTPTNTFHLAPIVVAVIWPVVRRVDAGRPLPKAEALLVAGTGTAVAIGAGVALALTGNLDGPALWGSSDALVDDPLVEVVVFALVGGLAGYRIVGHQWRGMLF